MKPAHPAGIHVIACVDKDGVAQVRGYELHRKFKDARMVSVRKKKLDPTLYTCDAGINCLPCDAFFSFSR
jgi:hypothetical protein